MRLKSISIKKLLIFFLFSFVAFISFQDNTLYYISKCFISVFCSVAFETLAIYFRQKKIQLTESSFVTGFIIGFVLSSDAIWWVFALASILAIFSKYVLQHKNKHIFNPAAFGIFATILITRSDSQWLGAFDWAIIVPCGLYFAFKIKKLLLVFAFFIFYVFFSCLESGFSLSDITNTVLYANYFFILIMLTEPKTTPYKNGQKIVVAGFISTMSYILGLTKMPYDPILPALLFGNLFFFMLNSNKKTFGKSDNTAAHYGI